MSYGNEHLSPVAREIKQYIYDASIFDTELEAMKGDAAWWAGQIGTEEAETRDGLEELSEAGTVIRHVEGESVVYIYVPMTGVTPELHGG